jgi:putative tryptophan/tyrosine transport system substrate-binding protein
MAGKKWIKAALFSALGAAVLCAAAGCGTTADGGKPKVGIVQIVQHPALDAANKGFVKALEDRGLAGKIEIDQQNAQGDQSNLRSIANRFVSGKYKLIGAVSTPAAQAMANATSEIPIICTAVTNYETAKLMKSEAAPDANVTGTSDRGPVDKEVALIREIQPDVKRIGMIYNSSEINSVIQAEELKKLCEPLGITVVERTVNSINDIQQIAEAFVGDVEAIYVPTDNVVASAIPTLMSVANAAKIPVYGAEVGHVENGVLASESISYYDIGYQAGQMASDILEGKNAVKDHPVETAKSSILYINKAEAELLGIQIPQSVLDRAKMI